MRPNRHNSITENCTVIVYNNCTVTIYAYSTVIVYAYCTVIADDNCISHSNQDFFPINNRQFFTHTTGEKELLEITPEITERKNIEKEPLRRYLSFGNIYFVYISNRGTAYLDINSPFKNSFWENAEPHKDVKYTKWIYSIFTFT